MSYMSDPYQVKATPGTLITCDSSAKQILLRLEEVEMKSGREGFVVRDIDDSHIVIKTSRVEWARDKLNEELEKNTYVPDPNM